MTRPPRLTPLRSPLANTSPTRTSSRPGSPGKLLAPQVERPALVGGHAVACALPSLSMAVEVAIAKIRTMSIVGGR